MEQIRGHATTPQDLQLDVRLFKRIWRCFAPFWSQRSARIYWLAMGVVLIQSFLSTALALQSSYWLKDVTNALVERQLQPFSSALLIYMLLTLAAYIVPSLASILSAWVGKAWRQWLTGWVTQRYLQSRAYYQISMEGDIDNPDQRIQESIAALVLLFFGLPITILGALGSFFSASIVLGTIDLQLALIVGGCSVLQCVLTYFAYVPLVRLRYSFTLAAAELRYALAHVKDNAEAIAFYRGEVAEQRALETKAHLWARRQLILSIFKIFVSDMVPVIFNVLWTALPYLILASRFFADEIDYGSVVQGIAVTLTVAASANALLGILAPLSGAAPHAVRVAQLLERADVLDQNNARAAGIIITHAPEQFSSHCLSLETPAGEQLLVRNLDFSLSPSEHLIILGPTGTGKSSLLRAFAGIWRRGEGQINLPPSDQCLFLPQRPYVAQGTLREQLSYPATHTHSDKDLVHALDAVCLKDLMHLHGGLDTTRDWQKLLSLGQQQSIAIARVLLTRPRLVLLDEATSAVDAITEMHLYCRLIESGARLVSVAHRRSLLKFHDRVLTLRLDGSWHLDFTSHYDQPAR